MKKFTKISLTIVGGMMAAGFVLCIIANILAGGRTSLREMAQNGELGFGNWYVNKYGISYTVNNRNADSDYRWHWDVPDAPDAPTAPEQPARPEAGTNGELICRFALSEVQNLELDLDIAELVVCEGSSADEIVVTLKKGEDQYFSAGMDGDTLKVVYDMDEEDVWLFNWNWNRGVTWNRSDVKIVVEIPADAYFDRLECNVGVASVDFDIDSIRCDRLELDAGVGDVTIAGFTVEHRMEVDAGTGNVDIAGGTYQDVEVDCGVGDFTMKGTVQGNMTATCGVGNMELTLTGKETDYNYDLSYGMGDMNVNGTRYGGGIDGKQYITNEGAIATISLDCGVGDLELHFTE